MATKQVGGCWPSTTIRHVRHSDAHHHLEQLASEMWCAAPTSGSHCESGICLGVGDGFGNRLGRNRWVNHHDQRSAGNRDDRDIANKVGCKFLVMVTLIAAAASVAMSV